MIIDQLFTPKPLQEGGPYDLPGIDYDRPGDAPRKRPSGEQNPYPYSPEEDDDYFREIFRKKREAAAKDPGMAEGNGRDLTNTPRDQFISRMTPSMDANELRQKVDKIVNSPGFTEDTILQIVDAGDNLSHPAGRYIQQAFYGLQYNLGKEYEDYPERVAEKLLSQFRSMLPAYRVTEADEWEEDTEKRERFLKYAKQKLMASNGNIEMASALSQQDNKIFGSPFLNDPATQQAPAGAVSIIDNRPYTRAIAQIMAYIESKQGQAEISATQAALWLTPQGKKFLERVSTDLYGIDDNAARKKHAIALSGYQVQHLGGKITGSYYGPDDFHSAEQNMTKEVAAIYDLVTLELEREAGIEGDARERQKDMAFWNAIPYPLKVVMCASLGKTPGQMESILFGTEADMLASHFGNKKPKPNADPTPAEPKKLGETGIGRAVNDKGLTQHQWLQLVQTKFPDAKIVQAKMIDGPCRATLPDGRTLSWTKVDQGTDGNNNSTGGVKPVGTGKFNPEFNKALQTGIDQRTAARDKMQANVATLPTYTKKGVAEGTGQFHVYHKVKGDRMGGPDYELLKSFPDKNSAVVFAKSYNEKHGYKRGGFHGAVIRTTTPAQGVAESTGQDSKSWMASIRQQHPDVRFVQAKMPGAPIIALVNGKPVAQFDTKKGVAESKRNKQRRLNEAMLMEDPIYRSFKRVGRYIAEQKLTEPEILQIFSNAEAGMTDKGTGANRTFLGRGKDTTMDFAGGVADALKTVWGDLQKSVPVAAVDVAYDQATDALANLTGGQKGAVMQAIKKYRNLAKQYPKTAGLSKAALVAIAGLATGGAGLPAVAALVYGLDSSIKGEKLSDIALKAGGAAATAWAAGKLFGGGATQPGPTDSVAGLVDPTPDLATYTVQSGDTLSQIAQANNTSVQELIGLNPQLAADSGAVGGQSLNPDVIFPGQQITLPPGTPGADVYAGGVGTNANTMADIAKGNVPDSAISQGMAAKGQAAAGGNQFDLPTADAAQNAAVDAQVRADYAAAGPAEKAEILKTTGMTSDQLTQLDSPKIDYSQPGPVSTDSLGQKLEYGMPVNDKGSFIPPNPQLPPEELAKQTAAYNSWKADFMKRFPEATLRPDGTMQPFKSGLAPMFPGMTPKTFESVKLRVLPASKLIDQKATVLNWALNESVGRKSHSVNLTAVGTYTVFENVDRYRRAILEATQPGREQIPGLLRPDMPGAPVAPDTNPGMIGRGLNALDRFTSRVGGGLSNFGRQFTTGVTKEKLKMNWQQDGKPTDSDQLAAWLVTQKVPQEVVGDVFSKMGIPYTATAQPATTQPSGQTDAQATAPAKTGGGQTALRYGINPANGKPLTASELRDRAAARREPATVSTGTDTPTTAPAKTTTGGPPGFNAGNIFKQPGMEKYAKPAATPPAKTPNFAGPSGYGKTTMTATGINPKHNYDEVTGKITPFGAIRVPRDRAEQAAFDAEQDALDAKKLAANLMGKAKPGSAYAQIAQNLQAPGKATINTGGPNPNAKQKLATTDADMDASEKAQLAKMTAKNPNLARLMAANPEATTESRIAISLKKPVAEMLQMVETKEDVQRIKQFVDDTFVRYGAVNESAFAMRNQILEHVTQAGAQRRREHSQRVAH